MKPVALIIAIFLLLLSPTTAYTPGHKVVLKPPVRQVDPSRPVSRGDRGLQYIGIFEATAYNLTKNRTASGDKTRIGIVSVDPEMIPLGTRLYIEGYGPALASDTGDAIKGRMLDVWLPGDKAWEWGRRQVKVWVFER